MTQPSNSQSPNFPISQSTNPYVGPGQKRQVWRRITAEGEAWRFNRYAERAGQRAFADTPDDVDTS